MSTVYSDTLVADISRRWAQSRHQVSRTAATLAEGSWKPANGQDEIDARRARLRQRNIDLEGYIDRDDSLWAAFLARGAEAVRPVGRIVTDQPRRPAEPIGTGVLISPRLALTNNHVVESESDAEAMAIQLGYEYGDDGLEREYKTYPLDPRSYWFTDATLDFTVVAVCDLGGRAPGVDFGQVRLIEETGKILKGEAVNVAHHSGGQRKRISIRENLLVAEDDDWLHYTSDVESGGSGSPVFNDQWEMVALHHGGIPMRDGNGVRLARSGLPWTADLGDQEKAYVANEGLRVSVLVRRLKSAQARQSRAELIDEALEEGRPHDDHGAGSRQEAGVQGP